MFCYDFWVFLSDVDILHIFSKGPHVLHIDFLKKFDDFSKNRLFLEKIGAEEEDEEPAEDAQFQIEELNTKKSK